MERRISFARTDGHMAARTMCFSRRGAAQIRATLFAIAQDLETLVSARLFRKQCREVTIRHDLHAVSIAFGYWIDHNWARKNPVRGVEIPSDKGAVRMYVLSAAKESMYSTRRGDHQRCGISIG